MESSKNVKKNDRKHRKHLHVLQKETAAVCTIEPTKNIGICNAGLPNGLTETVLVENFCEFGNIERISMVPGKSCCFISFQDVTFARKAFEATNGKLEIAQNNKPIFLSYVEEVPTTNRDTYRYENKPPGLIILENFITEEEEKLLLNLNNFTDSSSTMKHRKVRHYGYEFNYSTNNVDPNTPLPSPIPNECDFLWERLENTDLPEAISKFKPEQLTVNYYTPGQGIPSHVDTHSAFEDPILSLSLSSAVCMEFKRKNVSVSVILPRRSLLVMSGESRYDWLHGITPRKSDVVPTATRLTVSKRGERISFTFRRLRRKECDCEFRDKCDSRMKLVDDGKMAERLESLYVNEVYEKVAGHFSETRSKPWPNVLEFVETLEAGSVLVDVGCGNGKYLHQNSSIYDIGCDRSFNLIDICHDRGFEVFTCNCLSLPIRDRSVDAVISIAVIHHLSTENRRFHALKEIVRILRKDGVALIYVWARDQVRNNEKSSYLKQNRKNRKTDADMEEISETVELEGIKLPVHVNRKQFQHQDVMVPWKTKNQNGDEFLRFYHVFEEGELEKLCTKIVNVEIVKSYYDQGNWCVIIKKTS